jgi:hypothetical protein
MGASKKGACLVSAPLKVICRAASSLSSVLVLSVMAEVSAPNSRKKTRICPLLVSRKITGSSVLIRAMSASSCAWVRYLNCVTTLWLMVVLPFSSLPPSAPPEPFAAGGADAELAIQEREPAQGLVGGVGEGAGELFAPEDPGAAFDARRGGAFVALDVARQLVADIEGHEVGEWKGPGQVAPGGFHVGKTKGR